MRGDSLPAQFIGAWCNNSSCLWLWPYMQEQQNRLLMITFVLLLNPSLSAYHQVFLFALSVMLISNSTNGDYVMHRHMTLLIPFAITFISRPTSAISSSGLIMAKL